MRENKQFGKRRNSKKLPDDKSLKEIFGIVNDGYESNRINDSIRKMTSHNIMKGDNKNEI